MGIGSGQDPGERETKPETRSGKLRILTLVGLAGTFDADQPLARRVLLDTHSAYDDVITGDLRTVPIPPRAFDVVYCAALLERVRHVELVLDRLNGALKPGGLLFLRTAVRYSATALLDRVLPGPARRAVWSRFRPGIPGPVPRRLRGDRQRGGHRLLRPDARPGHRCPPQ